MSTAVTKPLTVKQVAERLGISRALVYALISRKEICHERHGLGRGVIRITEEALEGYRRTCQVKEEEERPAPPPVRVRLKRLGL